MKPLELKVDEDHIAKFVETIFKHASDGVCVSLRSFPDDDAKGGLPFSIEPVKLNGAGREPLIENAIIEAEAAARARQGVVFCPPLAGFDNPYKADERSLVEGYAITAELDKNPAAALVGAIEILDLPTIIVASGGLWSNPDTGKDEEKLHAHWVLTTPAIGEAALLKLKAARGMLAELVGGDPTIASIVHPVRWPGSWHRKGEPRLARITEINPLHEIDLDDAYSRLETALQARAGPNGASAGAGPQADAGGAHGTGDGRSNAELIANITSGREYHPSLVPLAARLIGCGMHPGAVVETLRGFMTAVQEDIRAKDWLRWQARYDSIPKLVSSAEAKFRKPESDKAESDDICIQSSAEFVANWQPPNWLVEGLFQQGWFYSLTSPTGGGKTAVTLYLMASVAGALPFGERKVLSGRVLYLAGENDVDVRTRWRLMAEKLGFAETTVSAYFLPSIVNIDEKFDIIRRKVEAIGGVSLVIVDTGPAYFPGLDENDNKQMGGFARQLRRLTELPGKPCTIVNCHPAKHAGPDNMQPRGGGAFIAEVDGNMTCANRDGVIHLHWQLKLRGPHFEPVAFDLREDTSDLMRDSDGCGVASVYAVPISEKDERRKMAKAADDENAVLIHLEADEGASIAEIANALGWKTGAGEPQKSRVHRIIEALKGDKLVTKVRGKAALTERGRSEARKAKHNRDTTGARFG